MCPGVLLNCKSSQIEIIHSAAEGSNISNFLSQKSSVSTFVSVIDARSLNPVNIDPRIQLENILQVKTYL